ncbi:hypothetical protein [Amorphus sp. MBR-141]
MFLRMSLLSISVVLAAATAQAAGFLPNFEVEADVDIKNFAVNRTEDPSWLRVSFVLENAGAQPVRLNRVTVGGNHAEIFVGGAPVDQSWPGFLVLYDEILDFSTSHLVAKIRSDGLSLEDSNHVVVEMGINGADAPISIHRIVW